MLLVQTITDALVATVNEAHAKWAHRPAAQWQYCGGQGNRTIHAARRKARAQLAKLTFTPAQIDQILRDAMDIAELERNAQETN